MLKWAFNPMLRCGKIHYELEMNTRQGKSLRFLLRKAIRLGGEAVEYFKGRSPEKIWSGRFTFNRKLTIVSLSVGQKPIFPGRTSVQSAMSQKLGFTTPTLSRHFTVSSPSSRKSSMESVNQDMRKRKQSIREMLSPLTVVRSYHSNPRIPFETKSFQNTDRYHPTL